MCMNTKMNPLHFFSNTQTDKRLKIVFYFLFIPPQSRFPLVSIWGLKMLQLRAIFFTFPLILMWEIHVHVR